MSEYSTTAKENACLSLLLAGLLLVGFVGGYAYRGNNVAESPAPAITSPTPVCDMTLTDRLVMTLAVGMDGSAVITSVGFASSDPREPRELELRGDTAEANGVVGIPTEPGTWRCVVEEWANEFFREFRVAEARRLM